jgi:hypothetical protein
MVEEAETQDNVKVAVAVVPTCPYTQERSGLAQSVCVFG